MNTIRYLTMAVAVTWITVFFVGIGMSAENLEENKTKITWYFADFPPLTIPYGSDAGKGYADQQRKMLIDRLKGYEHESQVANFARIVLDIKSQKNVCCATLLKNPEREKFIEYSIPIRVTNNNGVIIKKSDRHKFAPYLDKNGSISLERVLENKNLTMGVSKGRAYSKEVDSIIDKYRESRHVQGRSGQDVFKGLLSMLLAGRTDYILGYPTEANYVALNMGQTENLLFFVIAEMAQPYIFVYVGCPKNEWGTSVIKDINPILRGIRTMPKFLDFYQELLDEGSRLRYEGIVRQTFGE